MFFIVVAIVFGVAACLLVKSEAGWLVGGLLGAFVVTLGFVLVLYRSKVGWPELFAGLAVALMLAIPPAWTQWRVGRQEERLSLSEKTLERADLRGRDLRGFFLPGKNLRDAKLVEAKLADTNLFGADLSGADLRGADLERAVLTRANLSNAQLSGADLRRSMLNSSDLTGACLTRGSLDGRRLKPARLDRADLSGANLNDANLVDVRASRALFEEDLRAVRNFEEAVTRGLKLDPGAEPTPRVVPPPSVPRIQATKTLARQERVEGALDADKSSPRIEAQVQKVSDGDTVLLRLLERSPAPSARDSESGARVVKGRLAGVNAPSENRASGPEAKELMESEAPPRSGVSYQAVGQDQFERTLILLYRGEQLVNERLVAAGRAKATELLIRRGHTTPKELLIPLADARAVERRLMAAEDRPKELALGVWSICPTPD